jgi:acetyl-CoA synthase
MKFTTLAGLVGGGKQTPGFLGISKHYIYSRKFIKAEGGIKRVVWLPKMLKDEISQFIKPVCEEIGIPDFLDMVADETVGVSEEEILPFLEEKSHPALTMEPLI